MAPIYYSLTANLPSASDLSKDQIVSTIEKALAQWSAVAPLSFAMLDPSSKSNNYKLLFSFESLSGSHTADDGDDLNTDKTLGLTLPIGGLISPTTRSTAIRIEVSYPWTESALLGVAVHEIGHAIGLQDTDEFDSVMYRYAFNKDNDYSGLSRSDAETAIALCQQQNIPLPFVLGNSPFTLKHAATGQSVAAWYSGSSYYYPQVSSSLPVEPLQFVSSQPSLKTGSNVFIVTTNTSGMDSGWQSYNQMTAFNDGVGYWNYSNPQSQWTLEYPFPDPSVSANSAMVFGSRVRIKNVSYASDGYLYPYPGENYLWTKSSPDDDTEWFILQR